MPQTPSIHLIARLFYTIFNINFMPISIKNHHHYLQRRVQTIHRREHIPFPAPPKGIHYHGNVRNHHNSTHLSTRMHWKSSKPGMPTMLQLGRVTSRSPRMVGPLSPISPESKCYKDLAYYERRLPRRSQSEIQWWFRSVNHSRW